MKKINLLICLLNLLVYSAIAQTTLTLKPGSASGKDAMIDSYSSYANTNFGNASDNACWAWTYSGGPTTARGLFQFDLTSIPTNATIVSANLSLYCNTSSGVSQLHSGANSALLQRITSAWNESSVTWNNQPSTTNASQASLAQSSTSNQDYTNIDVKQLVADMIANPVNSFGFMLKLQTEQTYRSLVFASSDHADSTKRPQLVVTYTTNSTPPPPSNTTCLTFKPGASIGKDAMIDGYSSFVNTNYANAQDNGCWSWTYSGGPTTARSLMEFGIGSIPTNAIIQSAKLSLYCNTSSSVTQLHSGTNGSFLRRITSAWSENTVTWTNQPNTTTTNQVSLSQSSNNSQNYLDIDVVALLNDARTANQNALSMMLMLQTEQTYRSLIFASSDHPDSTRWPKLEICYQLPTVALTFPNGNDTLFKNKSYNIAWTASSNISNVRLDYTTNNGGSWSNITSSTTAGTGTFSWTPGFTSNTCRVRVTSTADSSISDTSNNTFVILDQPAITLTSPNGAEVWFNNATQNITWTATGSANVKLEYTTNGTSWSTIINSTPSAAGTYAWTLPSINSTTVKVRITDVLFPTYGDTSNANFTIRPIPTFTLTSPNGGEIWLNSGSQIITWTSTNSTNVKLEYTTNGNTWNTIAASTATITGAFVWNLPAINSTSVSVRISDVDFPAYADNSNNVFTIRPAPSVSLTSPNGGEVWLHNTARDITWNSANSSNLKIEYTTNGTSWNTIITSTPAANGSYTWSIPSSITATTVKVRISDTDFPTYNDQSSANFTIRPAPVVTLTAPNGGEVWINTGSQAITWTASNSTHVRLEYSTDNTNWNTITSSTPAAAGTYNWTLPTINSSTVKVRISDVDYPSYSDVSDNVFTIHAAPLLMVTSPNGGETWYIGTVHNITWNSSNSSNIRIDFTTDNTNWNTIVTSVSAASGTYAWTVPNITSSTVKVRISDLTYTTYTDQSDNNFSIGAQPALSLTNPNGGENWQAGSVHPITWNATAISQVNLEYTTNGTTWTTITTGLNAATGTYNWTVPNIISSTCKVRIADASNITLNDESNASFTISPATGLQNVSVSEISFYPNPATQGYVIINLNGNKLQAGEIILMNSAGSIVQQQTLSGNIRLDVSSLRNGLYYLIIKENGQVNMRKALSITQ